MKIFNNIRNIRKAYTEGIYADTYQNRKLGRVGMSYAAYSQKLKDEEEEKVVKKYYYVTLDDGQEFMLDEGKTSKNKAIESAVKYVEDMVKDNDYNEFSITLEENIDGWSEEDIENKKWEWYSIRAEKHGKDVEISVYDYTTNEYIRNDRMKREEKEFAKKQEELKKKQEKEFKDRFGWMEELIEFQKKHKLNQYNLEIRNDDNVLNVFVKDLTGRIFGGAESTKDLESKTIYFDSLNLDPEYRGKGLGGELLQKFIDIAQLEENYNTIRLEVDSGLNYEGNPTEEEKKKNNQHLIDFYKKYGFKVTDSEGLYTEMKLKI